MRFAGRLIIAAFASAAFLAAGCGRSADVAARVIELPSPAAPGSSAPHLAMTTAGAAVMSWLEPVAGGGHALKFATLDAGGWSQPRLVAQGAGWFVNWADFPSVTPITARDWVAHWLVKQPGGTYAYDVAIAISRDAGASWSAPFTPHDDGTATEHGFVTLFPWADGFGAAWLDGRRTASKEAGAAPAPAVGGMTVRYARIGFDGTIREGGEIDDLACDCCATDVAMTDAGPVATWRNRTADEIRDIAVSRFADGAWQPPVILGDDEWHVAGCPVNGSTIAARGPRVVVAWFTASRRRPRVQLAWSDDGGRTFPVAAVVEEGKVGGRVDVDLIADDMAVVTWNGRTEGGDGQLRMRLVPARGEPGPVRVIAEGDVSRAGGFPQMINTPGGLVYAWTQPGEPSRVLTARSPLE